LLCREIQWTFRKIIAFQPRESCPAFAEGYGAAGPASPKVTARQARGSPTDCCRSGYFLPWPT
jgi:hypothetical protein